MNSNRPNPQKITLEDIAQRKENTLAEIRIRKEAMTEITRQIVAPLAPVASGAGALMRSFNTGMAIFDGVMLGLKLMRKFRNAFGKRSS